MMRTGWKSSGIPTCVLALPEAPRDTQAMSPIIPLDPQCTSIKGLMVSIRWHLGSLKGELVAAGPKEPVGQGLGSLIRLVSDLWG